METTEESFVGFDRYAPETVIDIYAREGGMDEADREAVIEMLEKTNENTLFDKERLLKLTRDGKLSTYLSALLAITSSHKSDACNKRRFKIYSECIKAFKLSSFRSAEEEEARRLLELLTHNSKHLNERQAFSVIQEIMRHFHATATASPEGT